MTSSERYGDPETRQRILETTWRLIEARGPGVRLGDVAEVAGVSRRAIYLHFGNRAGLLLSLVRYMDETLGLEELLAPVRESATGVEAMTRLVEFFGVYTPKIDSVARVLEAAQHDDEALRAAWRDRMDARRQAQAEIIRRIAGEVGLAEGWTVDTATDLFYTLTLPVMWRELTGPLGWSADEYVEYINRVLRCSILAR